MRAVVKALKATLLGGETGVVVVVVVVVVCVRVCVCVCVRIHTYIHIIQQRPPRRERCNKKRKSQQRSRRLTNSNPLKRYFPSIAREHILWQENTFCDKRAAL